MKKILILIILTLSFTSLFAETLYYPNGKIKQEDNFINGTGSYNYYNEDGSLEESGSYLNGQLDGVLTFYKNKKISSKATYKNGILNGSYTNYYSNSTIKETGSYKDGKEYGTITTYYQNGNTHYKMDYKYGKRDGLTIGYYKNGNILEKGNFSHDNPNETSYIYYENGNIHWKSDITGTLTHNSDGSINIIKTLKSGKVKGSVTEYHKDGSIKKVHKLD